MSLILIKPIPHSKMWDNFYAFCTTINKKFHTLIYECGKNGGAEENRTPVRKPIRQPFYTLSEVF